MQDIKCNVVLIGKTGAGKSSFANYLFDTEKFSVSTGKPCTGWEENFQVHSLDIHGVITNVYDTVGLEADNYNKWISDIKEFFNKKQALKNPNDIMHALFYVVNVSSARIEENELDELYKIQKQYNLSTAVILTNCDIATDEQKKGLINLIKKKNLKFIQVCSTSKKIRGGKTTTTFGRDEALEIVLSSSYEKVGKELAIKSLEILIDKVKELKKHITQRIDDSDISIFNISNMEKEFDNLIRDDDFEKIFSSNIENSLPKEYLTYMDFLDSFNNINFEGKDYLYEISELIEEIDFDKILEKSEISKKVTSFEERFENDSIWDKFTATIDAGIMLLRLKTVIKDALDEVVSLMINQFEIIKRNINNS
ncbi:GTPase domain-containing protein [Aliarcobacter butzleri]|jgi:GTP-binding protein EngB required for normal cell division|uniref:GTPase n=1 Tax=Aliarcobacter butzleri TaxID=28197 RepID=UPI0024DED11F|nr:GTPase domain-containing protein [Aliarcobacter butzleri]MDK2069213.1 GTPase domain-containing protein [Aliarcobacter butzleri]